MRRALLLLAVLLCLALPAGAGIDFESSGSDQRYEVGSKAIVAYPFSIACTGTFEANNHNGTMVAQGDEGSATTYIMLRQGTLAGTEPDFHVRVVADTSAETANSYSLNTWHHFVASASATDVTVVLGQQWANRGTDTHVIGFPAATDNTTIGVRHIDAYNQHYDGSLARIAIWEGVEFGEDQTSALASGAWEAHVEPELLAHLWPCSTASATIPDVIGGLNMTRAGAPVKVGHKNITVWPGSIGGME